VCPAQQVQQFTPVRYHFGDDARWADPNRNDNLWSVAADGRVPTPAIDTDGFVWSRIRVAVPHNMAGPLAIRWDTGQNGPNVQEVYVNGVRVGRTGEFPPGATMRMVPENLVFDLPPSLVREGTFAEVAIRSWTPPVYSRRRNISVSDLSIDGAALQHALAGEAEARTLLGYMPQFAIGLLLEVLGIGVLVLGLWSGRRELFLCALWLVTMPVFLTLISLMSFAVGVGWRPFLIIFELINALGMCVVVEFIWTVQGFQEKLFRGIAHVLWVMVNAASLVSYAAFDRRIVAVDANLMGNLALFGFNAVTFGACVWALTGRGSNRAIAAAMALINVGFFLRIAGHPLQVAWLRTNFFGAAFYFSSVVIAALLIRQTWEAWKKNDGLRIEIAAARELQQQLVPLALPVMAGLEVEAAYLPAQEVGGDFYQVMEQNDGAALILVGDVSGKGLKAAMTGVLTIGAARALIGEALRPAALLTRLNQEITRSSKEGFVTCLCARVLRDGTVTLANAGHLAPYRNGEEVAVDSGLPLGIAVGVEYTETTLQLAPGDSLTFLSDGVVEAQNAAGELFGFARTEALATKRAEEIANAAKAFGQADDITVLTVAFVPVPAAVRPALA
jgi:hypothetical protein